MPACRADPPVVALEPGRHVAIAAVVVGGTSIRGGKGTVLGTLLGVALLGTIGTALTFVGVSAFWEKAVQGAIILVAVASDVIVARRGTRTVTA